LKKLVEVKDIQKLSTMLDELKFSLPTSLWDKVDNIISFVDGNIARKNQSDKNEFKRAIYQRMKAAPTEELNKKWYSLYKRLDSIFEEDKEKDAIEQSQDRLSELLLSIGEIISEE